jgi:thiol-disulfide isomerase/thioredoxin
MKKKLLLLFIGSFILSTSAFAQKTTEVPLSSALGYSLFSPGMSGIVVEPEDSPFKSEVKGIPENLSKITKHQFRIDEKQFFYQLFVHNKISKEVFDSWMRLNKYVPNEKELSRKPLRVSVYIIVGEDKEGNKVWLADTNTNLDFSDEQARPLLMYSTPFDFNKYKSFADNAVQVTHQRLRNGNVVEEVFPLAIVGYPGEEQLYFNFPKHYSATIKTNRGTFDVAFQAGDFLYNTSGDTMNTSLVVLTGKEQDKIVDQSVPVRPNQYFYLGDEAYQYLGIDLKKGLAKIKSIQDASTLKSAQVGFIAPDLTGKDFQSGKDVTMEQLKGKYVLLDFWATWCGPCIQEFPKLKALADRYDKGKFEILGVIGQSEPKDVTKLLDKHKLTWSQVLSDRIVEQYGVFGFPSTLLISPEGKVLYKNLRGEELEKVLAGLIK